ncbi:MAG: hypothetical protein GY953_06270, partial [bacterium]|nr:hypothetical protein [bacterium]
MPRANNDHPIHNDQMLAEYIVMLSEYPVLRGIQAEGLDWPKAFSAAAVAKLDYVLSDALTFPEKDGRLVRLWRPGVTVGDTQDFMERYTAFNIEVMAREPIDIIANPLFLPEVIQSEAKALWTETRMRRIVDAAVKYNIAVEINSRYRLPHERFIRMARAAGVKFSFGSNVHGRGVGQLGYCRKMVRKVGLTSNNTSVPRRLARSRSRSAAMGRFALLLALIAHAASAQYFRVLLEDGRKAPKQTMITCGATCRTISGPNGTMGCVPQGGDRPMSGRNRPATRVCTASIRLSGYQSRTFGVMPGTTNIVLRPVRGTEAVVSIFNLGAPPEAGKELEKGLEAAEA